MLDEKMMELCGKISTEKDSKKLNALTDKLLAMLGKEQKTTGSRNYELAKVLRLPKFVDTPRITARITRRTQWEASPLARDQH